MLATALLEDPHETVDGEIEVTLQGRTRNSADSPTDRITGEVAVSILASAVLGEMRWVDVYLDAPANSVDGSIEAYRTPIWNIE